MYFLDYSIQKIYFEIFEKGSTVHGFYGVSQRQRFESESKRKGNAGLRCESDLLFCRWLRLQLILLSSQLEMTVLRKSKNSAFA